MSRLLKGLAYWSLEITGASILLFNYQPYPRQQQIIAAYASAKNAFRLASTLLALRTRYNSLMDSSEEAAANAHHEIAQKIHGLCEQSQGVYARMGQVASKWKGIVPGEYRQELSKLTELVPQERDYNQIRTAISETFHKEPKEIFDGFKTVPLSVNLFWQTYRAVLLDNYREVTVKVMPPSVRMQAQYDMALLRAALPYVTDYMQKRDASPETVRLIERTVEESMKAVEGELDLGK